MSFRLARTLPRPQAQAQVKTLCQQAMAQGADLAALARAAFPDLALDDIFDPSQQMGHAPQTARGFAKAVTDLPG